VDFQPIILKPGDEIFLPKWGDLIDEHPRRVPAVDPK
jgi:hypothetical protein